MKIITKIFVAASFLLASFANSFDEVPQFTFFHDVSKFDIAGIRLGMSASEADAAIKKALKLTDNDIKYDSYPKKNQVTNTKEPRYFTVEKDGIKVNVGLTPAVPPDQDNPMRVSLVTFKMPRTPENMLSMQKRAFEKYGKPSNGVRKTDREFTGYKWCYVVSEKRKLGCLHSTGAKLTLSPPKLEMTDLSYRKAVNEYLNKLKSSAPAF